MLTSFRASRAGFYEVDVPPGSDDTWAPDFMTFGKEIGCALMVLHHDPTALTVVEAEEAGDPDSGKAGQGQQPPHAPNSQATAPSDTTTANRPHR